MRAALVTPAPLDVPRGNAVTVARIAGALRARGVEVVVWEADQAASERAAHSQPAVVHAFHAERAGPGARALSRASGAPLVVTLTGTDVSESLEDPVTAPTVRDVLQAAAAVTAFHDSVARRVRALMPDLDGRIAVVPQSVWFSSPTADEADSAPRIAGTPCLLFPAGIRPVKRPILPLAALDPVVARWPELRLWYAGPALDAGEMRRLHDALAARPWAQYVGPVPHHAMPGLLAAADIVLNCSTSEGGMANAVLEALSLGRAVLASDIPGNRSVVQDGVTGLLFSSEQELADKARRLAEDPALRRRLGEAGRRLVATRFTPAMEVDGYLEIYRRVAAARVRS